MLTTGLARGRVVSIRGRLSIAAPGPSLVGPVLSGCPGTDQVLTLECSGKLLFQHLALWVPFVTGVLHLTPRVATTGFLLGFWDSWDIFGNLLGVVLAICGRYVYFEGSGLVVCDDDKVKRSSKVYQWIAEEAYLLVVTEAFWNPRYVLCM